MNIVALLAIVHHLLGIAFILLQMYNMGNKDEK